MRTFSDELTTQRQTRCIFNGPINLLLSLRTRCVFYLTSFVHPVKINISLELPPVQLNQTEAFSIWSPLFSALPNTPASKPCQAKHPHPRPSALQFIQSQISLSKPPCQTRQVDPGQICTLPVTSFNSKQPSIATKNKTLGKNYLVHQCFEHKAPSLKRRKSGCCIVATSSYFRKEVSPCPLTWGVKTDRNTALLYSP